MRVNYERLYPADLWFEELGSVIWWKCPIDEPPYVGTPLDSDYDPYYYTHFSILPNVLDASDDGDRVYSPSYQKHIRYLNKTVDNHAG